MTSDKKWIIVAIGFAVCFYLGWFLPFLWLVFLGLIAFVLLTPTQKAPQAPVAMTVVSQSQPLESYAADASLDEIESSLRSQLEKAKNEDVREGLNQALAIVAEHRGRYTSAPAVAEAPVVAEVIASAPVPQAKPIDQTLVLLYIGAFLLFGGMSLFAAYSGFGNGTRITTLAIMAAIFYAGGMLLHRAKENLRPAGVTFVSVGLLLIPLVGVVAAYLTDISNATIWLATSIIALPLYMIALYVTRAQVVGYMAFVMWLSLAESAVNLFDAPLYIFVWVAIALGIVTQLVLSSLSDGPDALRQPFRWSSMVSVPVAVIANVLGLGSGLTEWQLGVSLMLAGLYYGVCAYTAKLSAQERDTYYVVAHFSTVIGALLLIDDKVTTSPMSFGLVLSLVGLAHMGVWFASRTKLNQLPQYENSLYGVASILPFIATVWFYEESGWLLASLLVALAANVCLMLGRFRVLPAVMSVIIGLLLPLALANVSPGFSSDNVTAALSTYYLVIFICGLIARILRNIRPQFVAAMQVGYGIALGLSWILALGSDNYWVQVIMSLLTIASLVGVSAYEKRAELYYALPPIVAVLLGVILHHIDPSTDFMDVFIYSVSLAAVVSYAFSLILMQKRGEALLFMGIAGGVLAWLAATFVAEDHQVLFDYFAPTVLVITSLVTLGEQKRLSGGKLFILLPAAGLLLALCQAIYLANPDTNFLVYTHLWAAYAAAATYLVSKRANTGDNVQALVYVTLAIFTVPVVLKALDETSTYSLLLLFEQAAVLIAGVVLNKKLLTYWGAAVVVLSVVYMLRSFAYLQLLIIAVILISYAIFRLTRQK